MYLPPGLVIPSPSSLLQSGPQNGSTVLSLLASCLENTSIICVNYRLSPIPSPYSFPLPIFDTLKAFDYITSSSSPHNGGQTPRLGLYGSHIGGLLATTLALTEPAAIHALAVSEPVLDWVGLDEMQEGNSALSSQPKRKPKSALTASPPDPTRLLRIRSQLFRTPETYFDAFASPILFLRAPGRDCPGDSPDPFLTSLSPMTRAFGPYDDDFATHPSASPHQPPRRRKVLRRWPPATTDSTLPPYTRVYVRATTGGEAAVLRSQGQELVELMRRACFYGREKGLAEARVQLQKVTDMAESTVEGTIGTRDAVLWLRDKLEAG